MTRVQVEEYALAYVTPKGLKNMPYITSKDTPAKPLNTPLKAYASFYVRNKSSDFTIKCNRILFQCSSQNKMKNCHNITRAYDADSFFLRVGL